MIEYKLHENGWTVILENFNFKTATQQDINDIAKLLATNTLVVAKKQSLTAQDEVRVARMFKNPQEFHIDTPGTYDYDCYQGAEVENSERLLLRVSGEKDEHGRTGLAGWTDEMVWHCNDPHDPNRRPLIWLYGVKGTKGSRTTWNNNILSYNELDEERRRPLENLKLVMANWCKEAMELGDDAPDVIEEYHPNLVMSNIAGKKGFHFSFLQISGFVGLSEDESKNIISWLTEHTTQEKYCYHHDWEDGDVVIAEQWLGIHKRWPFDQIEKRTLHRIAFDFPDQDYSDI
jgi:alpha-ketoglutarate-dependent taurine dioxygenase